MTATDRWKRIQELFDLLESLPANRQVEELERVESDLEIRSEVLRLFQSMRDEEQAQLAAMRDIAAAADRNFPLKLATQVGRAISLT